MQSLEATSDEGEPVVKRLKALRTAAQALVSPKEEQQAANLEFDIFEELQKLYEEEETDSSDEEEQGVKYKTLILERLVKKENLNTIILNLYPGNKGYSLAFRLQDRRSAVNMGFKEGEEELIQTMTRGYEEDTILRYVDQEEIPPFILDAADKFDFLFYSGCLIAEIRNYRQTHPETKCFIHHVLLKPSQKTILADINALTQNRPDFTTEDRDALEGQIVIAQNPELCLDPNPNLEEEMAEIQNRKLTWNEQPFQKMARKASQVAASRKRKLDHFAHPPGLELLDFCRAKKLKLSATKTTKAVQSEEAKTVIPAPMFKEPALAFRKFTQPFVINELRTLKLPQESDSEMCDCKLYRIEDHVLETDIQDQNRTRIYHITLSILYRPSTMDFWGELYLDRDYKRGERNGTFCRFHLGTRALAHRYVYQFTEIFTESGRKSNVRVQSIVHINEPEEVIWPSNAFAYVPQRLPNPKEHMEKMNQFMQALSFQRTTSLQRLVEKVFKGDLESNLYAPTDLKSIQMTSQELEIDALATKLELSSQQFQAAEKAKRQAAAAAAQQKLLANSNIKSLLNSSPASNANSSVSAAVVNAINNAGVISNQQRILARTLGNIGGARVLSHGNILALNNHNRMNLQEFNAQLNNATGQTLALATTPVNNAARLNLRELNAQLITGQSGQTVTLTSVSNQPVGSYTYSTIPVKQQVVQRVTSTNQESGNSESVLNALLVGTPAADRPEIGNSNNANSLLLEKLAASSGQNPFVQKTPNQASTPFVVQSPKVISPMSSPPPQNSNTLNVQSLNRTQIQNISGLHNVQFQLSNFSQPISFAVNVGNQISGSGGSQGLLMSLPGTQTQHSAQGSTGQSIIMNTAVNNTTPGPSQLVSSGAVKNITTHHNIRTASGSQTLHISPGSHQFQLISQLQRPIRQQNTQGQAIISGRTLQRTQTPITIKMAPNSSQLTDLQFNLDN
ncbi:hypothetical protein ABEB36_013565 [Hypothenemus hampei]|uniref:Spt20-like SEP domain-containing protein n=1 Tax=Hypothenemus hampei TaxID=57062 RepID=A0ABD1E6Q9_HYPHA